MRYNWYWPHPLITICPFVPPTTLPLKFIYAVIIYLLLLVYENIYKHTILTGRKRYDYVNKEVIHITPVLAKLHWLPDKSRVSFMQATCTVVYNIPPVRLALTLGVAPCWLQTGEGTQIFVESVTGGYPTQAQDFTESFPSLGRRGWNSIPSTVRECRAIETFKKQLKAHLYNVAYKTG